MDASKESTKLPGSESLDNSNAELSEPATHSSASVAPTVYDADLLLRICPAHLMGSRCNHKLWTGVKCDRLLICEYVRDYVCEGNTCQYLHSIPRSCLTVKRHRKCREGCTDAHDFMDARTENAKELVDHCQTIMR
ncbi:hypothetical protein M747DRAFT_308041 [Aspergillus niger ATCC 13496]|uniref:Contig An01c0330, genomic contig n=3 Tax=Aspergillus niger TaxID=5061 RepID=A2QA43_ASPNC|nr:uncharacterized protein An01g10130 [Aspergillus niger]RDH17628.1 hypothetical protein M747DRAFT_308041 [Aspergillus niger ATCC 13496]CAK37195.1 unnamed protein product [Aspergillus niger]